MGDDRLALSSVSKRFGGVVTASELSVSIDASECTAIVGPNGAGKSTILNMVCGLIRPDAGQIFWRGEDITGRRFSSIARRGVGRMFQDLQLFGSMSAYENILVGCVEGIRLGPWIHGPSSKVRRSVWEVLERLNLLEAAGRQVDDLSYAEQKLVALGRTIVGRPGFLLLDEPASGLDHDSLDLVLDVIGELRSRGSGLVIVEHNLELVSKMATRALLLDGGRMVADDVPKRVFETSDFGRVFFSMHGDD